VIVHQWVPAAHRGDAVGDNARALRGLFRRLGHESDIFALSVDEGLRDDIRAWSEPASRQGDITILHFAMPSPMTRALATLPGARVLCYHNVTPPAFFAAFDPAIARLTYLGRQELESLVGRVDLAVGVSGYNRDELDDLGFDRTGVLPLMIDIDRLRNASPVPSIERTLQDGLTNILFVGRIAPNKKIEDHIRLAEHYKRYVDSYYRFIFVGRDDAVPRYANAIRALIAEYRMLPERFWFTGPVLDAELAAYYRNAHAYVSLSEHEGFCVPLVEAMATDVPVLAYGAAAVPETLGGAGVTFAPKDLEYASELLGGLIYDRPFREAVIRGQRTRVEAFRPSAIEPRIVDTLAAVGLGAALDA
jgi:glycosyltransferase involved in cell wall biosynthesis